jgi:hypothetical protein
VPDYIKLNPCNAAMLDDMDGFVRYSIWILDDVFGVRALSITTTWFYSQLFEYLQGMEAQLPSEGNPVYRIVRFSSIDEASTATQPRYLLWSNGRR